MYWDGGVFLHNFQKQNNILIFAAKNLLQADRPGSYAASRMQIDAFYRIYSPK